MAQTETDQRYLNTQQHIFNALLILLKQKSFEEISVRDLCTTAHVSRSGFYLHFADKYVLVDAYLQVFTAQGMALFQQYLNDGLNTVMIHVLRYLNDHGEVLTLLLSRRGSTDIQHQLKKALTENAAVNVLPQYGLHLDSPVAQQYLVALVTGGVLNILETWINNGRRETPEELMQLLSQTIMPTLKQSAFFS